MPGHAPDALLEETLASLRGLLGPDLDRLRVERAVVGIVCSGVLLSDGSGGTAGTPRPEDCCVAFDRRQPPSGAIVGLPVRKLFDPWPAEPYAHSLAVASLCALSAQWLNADRYRAVFDRDALDLVEFKAGMKVVLVGAFHSYIERIKAVAGLDLKVLELRPDALREEDMPFYVPAERAAEAVSAADAVIMTGLTVANGTLAGLLRLARPDAFVAVVGPTGSILPDALFRRGAKMASGCVLTDPAVALDLLSQGASARHLYGRCARKVNLLPR